MDGLEALVGELEQQARLADARVADDDVLEEVAVVVLLGFLLFCDVYCERVWRGEARRNRREREKERGSAGAPCFFLLRRFGVERKRESLGWTRGDAASE